MGLDIELTKKLMRDQVISQKELADMAGVTEAAMSRYLSGERQPRAETLANMATALHTTSNDLLGLAPPSEIDEVFRLVARNADAIPNDIRLQLIKLLSTTQNVKDNKRKG